GDEERAEGGTGTRTPVAGSGSSGPCRYLPATTEKIKQSGTPPATPPAQSPSRADIRTDLGTIAVELDPGKAPCTVNSLAYLAGRKFFDGSRCHRLTTDSSLKILQCGDPSGSGTGGPSYRFGDESLSSARYTRGTVAMANAGPGTNGSQFFILYADAERLPASYTVFGRVTSGMDVIDKVAKEGVENGTTDGEPKQRLTITELRTT
ncbi:peptidylprolyl isomerase, partial [Actinomadura welshii]